jgi:hypothetical protein
MKGYEAAQFAKDYEYDRAKSNERKQERAKRDQRRSPRGRGYTAPSSED